jgi:hypothetical protein
MIIRVERSGGFTGIGLRAVIDTDQLDPREQQELLDLLAASKFFEPTSGITSSAAGPDRFDYKLTIEQGAQRRSVEVNEGNIPPEWQALVRRINVLARRFRQ